MIIDEYEYENGDNFMHKTFWKAMCVLECNLSHMWKTSNPKLHGIVGLMLCYEMSIWVIPRLTIPLFRIGAMEAR